MKLKKLFAIVLATGMTMSLLSGCGGSGGSTAAPQASQPAEVSKTEDGTEAETEAEGPDLSEHVVLTMYCIGDEGGIHADEHIKLINDYLTEKINAEINPVMVSWGDYRQKLPMVWASGEAYDLTFSANWTGYFTEGVKGAFMDITDLLPVYAPSVYKSMQDRNVIDSVSINDRIYMVPMEVNDYTTFILNYREDLRKKYNCPEIVDDATLEEYLKAIRDNEPGMQAFGANGTDAMAYQNFLSENDWSRPLDNGMGFFVYDLKDPTHVFNVVNTPEYEAFVNKMAHYYEEGYVSKSIMANTDQQKDSFEAGKAGTYQGNFPNTKNVFTDAAASNPDWEIGVYSSDLASGNTEFVAPSNNGMSIGAYSNNPERALMFMELLYTDRTLYNLVVNGIEGVTFEWDEATGTKWLPEGVDPSELALKNLGMGLKSEKFELASKDDPQVVNDLMEEYEKVALLPELSGFVLDQDDISAQLAAIKAVQDEYKVPLDKGVVEPASGLLALQDKVNSAGAKEVEDEINKQIAEFLAK